MQIPHVDHLKSCSFGGAIAADRLFQRSDREICHHEIPVEDEQRVGNARIKIGNESGDVADLFSIDVAGHKKRGGSEKMVVRLWEVVLGD